MTIRQCVIAAAEGAPPVGGRTALAWQMRELQRFGVEEFVVLSGGGGHPEIGGLPKPARVRFAVDTADAGVTGRFLLCRAAAPFAFNLAPLLADFAADPPGTYGRRLETSEGDTGIGVFEAGLLQASGAPGLTLCTRAHDDGWAARPRPALFLDRDGVLNVDHGYVGTRERFAWVEGALAAVRQATAQGWHVFVVTNQSGVARGLYGEAEVAALMAWVEDEVRRHGGTIDDYCMCPFHPQASVAAYRRDSDWRKPGPGMLLDLLGRWALDPARCLMVGDKDTDMAAAAAAAVKGALFPGGNLETFMRPLMKAGVWGAAGPPVFSFASDC